MDRVQVRAAGAVIVRGDGEDLEVLLIHRPRYDDWSHPKGKCDKRESHRDACVREVQEETGLHVELGAQLQTVRYVDGRKRNKRVKYWIARPVCNGEIMREPDDEVDEATWFKPAKARKRLTGKSDRRLLDEALEILG